MSSRISRREWAGIVTAVPLAAASARRACVLAGEFLKLEVTVERERLLSRRVTNRLTGTTAELPPEEFSLEFGDGYHVASSQMRVAVAPGDGTEVVELFTGDRVEVRCARRLLPGKAYVRKQLSVRVRSGPPVRLLRAELDDWRGVRRDWKSITADSAKYGSHPIYCNDFGQASNTSSPSTNMGRTGFY